METINHKTEVKEMNNAIPEDAKAYMMLATTQTTLPFP